MNVTKFSHSCLLVEIEDRVVLFDPGEMSTELIDPSALDHLDDIIITHEHSYHMSIPLVQRLLAEFPKVRITAPDGAVSILDKQGIVASPDAPSDVELFESPHEDVAPLAPKPDHHGAHLMELFTHPGDSLHFEDTMPVLALPVTAPWGTTVDAVNLAIDLVPEFVIPIHDWFWKDEAKAMWYDRMEQVLKPHGITLLKPVDGTPLHIDI